VSETRRQFSIAAQAACLDGDTGKLSTTAPAAHAVMQAGILIVMVQPTAASQRGSTMVGSH
jgi:hypothetical protein